MLPRDFPGSLVVKNLPANARDMGSIPGQGTKTPHAAGQLSLNTTTTKAHMPYSLCSAIREATAMRNPHTITRMSSSLAMKTQCSQN